MAYPHPAAGAALSLHPSVCTARKRALLFKHLRGGDREPGPRWGWGSPISFQAAVLVLAGTWFKVQLTGNVRAGRRARPGRGAQTGIFRGRLQGTEGSMSNPVLRVSALWDGTPLKAETLARLLGQIILHVFSS